MHPLRHHHDDLHFPTKPPRPIWQGLYCIDISANKRAMPTVWKGLQNHSWTGSAPATDTQTIVPFEQYFFIYSSFLPRWLVHSEKKFKFKCFKVCSLENMLKQPKSVCRFHLLTCVITGPSYSRWRARILRQRWEQSESNIMKASMTYGSGKNA